MLDFPEFREISVFDASGRRIATSRVTASTLSIPDSAAARAGATTLNLPDTVGYALPQEFGSLLAFLIEEVDADVVEQRPRRPCEVVPIGRKTLHRALAPRTDPLPSRVLA